MTRQETINKAIAWAVSTASNSAHGYDQANRWGPNYDCSSFVITAWNEAGVPVKSQGASYTGNMYFAFLRCGFRDVTNSVNIYTGSGLKAGDVLLNTSSHTELYIGDGKNVKASINERGGTTGGQSGDQNGREIYIGSYYNYPWNYVLRYEGDGSNEEPEPEPVPAPDISLKVTIDLDELQQGDTGEVVRFLQTMLPFHGSRYKCGIWGADGEFGNATRNAVEKFQKDKGLAVDSIVGQATWSALLKIKSK